jgi:hypothetical protein
MTLWSVVAGDYGFFPILLNDVMTYSFDMSVVIAYNLNTLLAFENQTLA